MLEAVIARGTTGPKITTLKQPCLPDRPKVFQPQIFVLPPNMFVSSSTSNGIQTLVTMATTTTNNNSLNFQKGQIQILSKPRPADLLRPISLKRPLAPASIDSGSSDDEDSKDGSMTEEERKVRKRANLDHLSQDEKMMRRKLKNRVAAQNARDKKRVKMEEMEVTLKKLEQQNLALAKKNEILEAENNLLIAENAQLRILNSSSNCISTADLVQKVEEDEGIPFSPESLPTPSHSNTSDFEDDFEPTFDAESNVASDDFSCRVASRFRGPAASTNVLQQKEQNRGPAGELRQLCNVPKQLACLLWMCLIGPLTSHLGALENLPYNNNKNNNKDCMMILPMPVRATVIPQILLKSNLPPKKRSQWWGSHHPSPHAKT